eukprot:1160894-Pelagomonas_calceolata.AAC.13
MDIHPWAAEPPPCLLVHPLCLSAEFLLQLDSTTNLDRLPRDCSASNRTPFLPLFLREAFLSTPFASKETWRPRRRRRWGVYTVTQFGLGGAIAASYSGNLIFLGVLPSPLASRFHPQAPKERPLLGRFRSNLKVGDMRWHGAHNTALDPCKHMEVHHVDGCCASSPPSLPSG